ncbi:MAG TPA: MFS transporter [Thermohalobaculum sp.]|nr:MFS transporter [Thermohalobaculum sp.]
MTDAARPGRTALSVAGFRRYYTGFWFATSGFWILKIAIGWSAWDLSHSPWLTGLVAALALMPTMALSPIFGVYADRIRLKIGIPVVISGQISVGLTLAGLAAGDALTVSGLIVLATAWGVFSAAYQPMRLSMIPRLVDRELFASALGLTSIAFNTARILGPAIGALIIARWGLATAFLVGTLGYVPFLVLFATVTLREREPSNLGRRSVLQELGDGARYAFALPLAKPILLITAVNGFVGRGFFEILPVIAGRILDAGAAGLAALTSAGGGGAILAGLALSRVNLPERLMMPVLLGVLALTSVVVAVAGWVPDLTPACALAAVAGFTASFAGITTQTLLQMATDDAHRGRVMSFWTVVSFGAPSLGAMAIGALGDAFGVAPGLATVGLMGLAVTTALALGFARSSSVDAH